MSAPTLPLKPHTVIYPEDDGLPMAENTLQFEWIVTIKGGLDAVFCQAADVFVAGDLLWYPVEGDNTICQAPDIMVALGRPKGYRGSYRQWEEGGIAPRVVFEILSPGNRYGEMIRKFRFYERYGVEEYYIYNPLNPELTGYLREASVFREIPAMNGWVSPLLKIRFDMSKEELQILDPSGQPFATYLELAAQRDQEKKAREQAQKRADEAQERANEAERLAARLAAQLRALGKEPDA